MERFLSSRSVRIGLVVFVALCLYVPWRVDRGPCPLNDNLVCGGFSLGYRLVFAGTPSGLGVVDLGRWLLGVLALVAVVGLGYWLERHSRR